MDKNLDTKNKSDSTDAKMFDIKLCVSGAAETSHFGPDAYEKGKELGREIARHGAAILTGATTGFPYWATLGAKEANGVSIGFSPATNEYEHRNAYRLPTDHIDLMVYTGFGYPGRDLMLTRSCDGILIGCGRIGTIHEFTIAYEDEKPIGVLEGSWKTDEVIKYIMDNSNRVNKKIVFDSDPKRLVEKVIELIHKDRGLIGKSYRNYDGEGNRTMYYEGGPKK